MIVVVLYTTVLLPKTFVFIWEEEEEEVVVVLLEEVKLLWLVEKNCFFSVAGSAVVCCFRDCDGTGLNWSLLGVFFPSFFLNVEPEEVFRDEAAFTSLASFLLVLLDEVFVRFSVR